MRRGTRHLLAAVLLLGLLALIPSAAAAQTFAGKVTKYVDPSQQTALSFGDRSHWLQPWRAYLDTVPATKLRDAIGIQFNVTGSEAASTARLLSANGFKRARLEVGWNSMSYSDPTRLTDPASLRTKLQALKTYGIRPLILLNAHHGAPGPLRSFNARTVEPAAKGARRLHLDSASAGSVVPGRTGLNSLTSSYKAADVIFTAIDAGGWVDLSRPLPRALPAGAYAASTLRFEPFQPPLLEDGTPNPGFEETMRGWLDYVAAVTREAKATLGNDAFDVEVWNEQSFGADFLSIDNYYDPPRGPTYASSVHETPDLVSYWRLGESAGPTARDSRWSNDGTYTGAVGLARAGALDGDINNAVTFEGGYVNVPGAASVDLGDRLSIEAWVRRGANGVNHTIIGKGSGAYILWITGDRLTLRKSLEGNIAQSTETLETDGRWHHVAATKDGPAVKLYIDGVDVTGPVTDRPLADNTLPLQIGANGAAGTVYRGLIDEAAVYSSPLPAETVKAHYDAGRLDPSAARGNVDRTILSRTVAWVRDPASGVPTADVGNGFASQRPWDAGSTSPPGLTAIDKHPYLYSGMRRFSPSLTWTTVDETRPLDAQGDVDGTENANGDWTERFTPTYDSFHPEYYLRATHKVQRYYGFPIRMDNLIRDLSPLTTSIGGVEHGRSTHPAGAAAPGTWITEMNIDPTSAPSSFGLTSADRLRFQAKVTLRTLTSFVNKGASAVQMYAVKDGNFALVSGSFFSSLASSGTYPGDTAGGEVMDSVRRLVAGFSGAVPLSARQLSLIEVGDYAGNKQFDGDGTADHPPLYNRDALAFLPFQVTDRKFVVPVYVMTTNLAKNYKPTAPSSDKTRFDMPAEKYRLTIGGVRGSAAKFSSTDPLTGASLPVTVISRSSDRVVVELNVTDSPRLLTIRE